MIVYMDNMELYAITEDNNQDYMSVELKLVAGWDYIDPDTSDAQGWVPADRFIEDVQYESVVFCFLSEGLIECLEENGYTVKREYKDYTK